MSEYEVKIPLSAASKNLRISLWFLALGLILMVCHVPWWAYTAFFAISGGFLISMIMCVMDVQEFKMKQSQKIIQLLEKVVNKDANK